MKINTNEDIAKNNLITKVWKILSQMSMMEFILVQLYCSSTILDFLLEYVPKTKSFKIA